MPTNKIQTALKMYEKVNIRLPLDQRRFFNYLNEAINEFISRYGVEYVLEEEYSQMGYRPIESLNDPIQIKAEFMNPILYDILGIAQPENQALKQEALRLGDEAYTDVWGTNAKGRHIKRERW